MIVRKQPNYPRTIGEDYWYSSVDYMELDRNALDMIDALNEVLKDHKPLSYSPGKQRIIYKYIPDNI